MCMMLYILQTNEQLETVLSYVPANVPISGDDIIPGVDETNYSEQGNVIDVFKFEIISKNHNIMNFNPG